MFKPIIRQGTAIGLLLGGVAAGVAGAQAVEALRRTQYIASGLFTLHPGEAVNFHVALDDRQTGPPGGVILRLYDEHGTVVARKTVSLEPGASATLTHPVAGRYRAQAEVFERSGLLSDRRQVASTVEIFDINDLTLGTRYVCAPGEGIDTGRQ